MRGNTGAAESRALGGRTEDFKGTPSCPPGLCFLKGLPISIYTMAARKLRTQLTDGSQQPSYCWTKAAFHPFLVF